MLFNYLWRSDAFTNALKIIINKKPKEKSFEKAIEELSELTTKLIKWVNDPEKVKDAKILEEIVDVQMNILVIESYFSDTDKQKMCARKIAKMLKSKSYMKYKAKCDEAK
jgi:hypothetical protein